MTLNGAKEGIGRIAFCFLNPDDIQLSRQECFTSSEINAHGD